jgi:phage protein D
MQDELREFSVLADLAGQRTSVSVNGWDVSAKSAIHAESSDTIIKGELNGDDSGASLLASAIGPRKESLTHTVPFDVARAQAEADSFFRLGARRFVTGRGVAKPDAKLRVGAIVDLKRLGPLFSGKYYISEVRHVFDGMGLFRTEFRAERPGLAHL